MILDKLWELKSAGINFFIVGHTKKRDIDDPVTNKSYSLLTTNISQRYFSAIKTKLHILGVAFKDDDYSIDGKSRFAKIKKEISVDADSFINAIEDAIKAAKGNNKPSSPTLVEEPVKLEKVEDEKSETSNIDALIQEIKTKVKKADKDVRVEVKEMLDGVGISKITDEKLLKKILKKLS